MLRCLWGIEHTTSHDTLQDTIVIIVLESGAHVQKGFPPFPLPYTKTMDIFITRNGFWTLVDVVIIDSIYTKLMQCASTMIAHATIVVVQDKHNYTQSKC